MSKTHHDQLPTPRGSTGPRRLLKTPLLMFACPLMHRFHGHGVHGGHGDPVLSADTRKD